MSDTMTTDELIDILTDGEGDSVTFFCKNPDFNGLPNECIAVNASWTNWQERYFRADTRQACLLAAVEAMRASVTRHPYMENMREFTDGQSEG